MNKIAFQGELGANSHIACREVYPDLEPLPCATFEDVFAADAADAIRARLVFIPRGGKPADARSICHPLVVNNLVTRAMNAAAAAGWPKVDGQVIGGC